MNFCCHSINLRPTSEKAIPVKSIFVPSFHRIIRQIKNLKLPSLSIFRQETVLELAHFWRANTCFSMNSSLPRTNASTRSIIDFQQSPHYYSMPYSARLHMFSTNHPHHISPSQDIKQLVARLSVIYELASS